MKHIIAENKKYISITVIPGNDISMSWEQLQEIKDQHFKQLDFIEVYPNNQEIINKANVRHLMHIKGWKCPKLGDLEVESDITIHE